MKDLRQGRYLVSSSETIILEHGQSSSNSSVEELQDLVLVQLSKLFLKDVDYLQYCTAIQICILANNYITGISALRACTQLIKLDLHGNQIQLLPDNEFWSELRELKLLYLHDNGICKLKHVQVLASCPSLTGLTLFDTPVSLKKRYRHIVVNSILSLKALDNYVISDAEIIEDCNLPARFEPLNPHLFLSFTPVQKMEINFEDETKEVKQIISKIDHILAHNSPVLIIQRMIRGYLTRKKLGLIRYYKIPKKRCNIILGSKSSIERIVDINTGSKRGSNNVPKSGQSSEERNIVPINQMTKLRPCYSPDNRIMYITVDLNKLSKEITQVELNEKEMNEILGSISGDQQQAVVSNLMKSKREEGDISQIISCIKDSSHRPEYEDKEKTRFRLSGFKANLHKPGTMSKMLILRKESGEDVRHSDNLFHSVTSQKPDLLRNRANTLQKKVQDTTYSPLNFTTFYAIEKAYTEKRREETQEEKICKVYRIHSANVEAKSSISGFFMDKRKNALKQREIDGLKLQKAVMQLQLRNSDYIGSIKERYRQFKEQKKQKEMEKEFVQAFRIKHNSVTKTLLNHDRAISRENCALEKKRTLEGLRQQQLEQRLLRKDLEEYRQSVQERENAADKAELGAAVSRKANDRLLQARANVTAVKATRSGMEPMQKVPVDQTVYKEAYKKYFSN
ncbi:leucine-rich repeat and IQ domain-containing protein 3 [Ambystoma mexicanum]|uniref:leucine-rich repeat and IQ domain-containing protein 3 n=1 Tax=Ambystoma mexicanum TaxID=8296 RepID=UPI0037E8DB5E